MKHEPRDKDGSGTETQPLLLVPADKAMGLNFPFALPQPRLGFRLFCASLLVCAFMATGNAGAALIGHWVADDLPLGNSGNWTGRVSGVVALIDRGSPQVSTGGGFNGHRYVSFNPTSPTDIANADTFYVPAGSAAHPTGPFSISVVFRMPATATGSGGSGGIWYENAALVGMEVAGSPNPLDWGFGVNANNVLSFPNGDGSRIVNSNQVLIATMVRTASDASVFINGSLDGQSLLPGNSFLTYSPIGFGVNRASDARGGSGFPERFFAGNIAEVRIHDSPIDSQAEFRTLQEIYLPAPNITQIEITGGSPQITFSTSEGSNYRVERKNSLSDPTWVTVTGASSVAGSGGAVQVTDPDSGAQNLASRFYRVVLLL